MTGQALEVWVVQSEHHIRAGSLAYWGPYESREKAEAEFADDEAVVVVEVPAAVRPYANWHEPSVIPTPQYPDQATVLRLLRGKLLALAGGKQP